MTCSTSLCLYDTLICAHARARVCVCVCVYVCMYVCMYKSDSKEGMSVETTRMNLIFFYWIFDRYSTSMSICLLTFYYNGNITRLPLVTCKTGLLSKGFATNTAVRLLSCMCVPVLEHSRHLCECSITDGTSIALLSTMDTCVTCKCMFVHKCLSTYITHVTTDSWVHHLTSITDN